MLNKNLLTLKLSDIKYLQWEASFNKDVFAPLNLKLKSADFWKKAESSSEHSFYWDAIYTKYIGLPCCVKFGSRVKPEAFQTEAQIKAALDSFFVIALYMWVDGLIVISAFYKYYPNYGLTFGEIELNFIRAWLDIIPCIDQLVLLLNKPYFGVPSASIVDDAFMDIITFVIMNKKIDAMFACWFRSMPAYTELLEKVPSAWLITVLLSNILNRVSVNTLFYLQFSSPFEEPLYISKEEQIEEEAFVVQQTNLFNLEKEHYKLIVSHLNYSSNFLKL